MHEYLKNKKILVTGHTGFVGTWLCAVLSYFKLDVTGFSLPEDNGTLYEKIKNKLQISCIYGDLRDQVAVDSLIRETAPDIIFHIAAFGFVKECFEDPYRAYSSNVQGTLNLLESLRDINKPCRIIVASSDKVYRNSGVDAYNFKENDPLGGSDPYSASKTCEDIVCQSYYDSYLSKRGDSMCIVRPSNILGGGDHNMNRLIPSIYYNLGKGNSPEIRNPDSVRPWQNILDIVDAYLTVAEKVKEGCRIYNVGPEQEGIKTVGEIATYVSQLYGMDIGTETVRTSEVKEKVYLGLSIDKIKREMNWKPKRSLEQTLDGIYDFYSRDNGNNTYDLCMSQINNYYNLED